MRDTPSWIDTARNAVVAGFRVTAFLFALGMLFLLYYIHAGHTHLALFWWTFTAVLVPVSVFYFYGEVRYFYLGYKDAITPHGWPTRHRLLALWYIVVAASLLAVWIAYY